MSVRGLIRHWLLEYAYSQRMSCVIQELQSDSLDNAPGTCLTARMLTCSLQTIIDQEDYQAFGAALGVLDAIYEPASEVVPFKQYAKILTGIKILHLFSLLRKGDRQVLPLLNKYFPRSGFTHPKGDEKLLKKLGTAQMTFRKFLLSLLANENQRARYLKNEFHQEYGSVFIRKLQQLTKDFVGRIEAVLPPTMIQKILDAGVESEFANQLALAGGIAVEILLDGLQGKKRLSEEDLFDMLDMMLCTAGKPAHAVIDLDVLGMDESLMSSGKPSQKHKKYTAAQSSRKAMSSKNQSLSSSPSGGKKKQESQKDQSPVKAISKGSRDVAKENKREPSLKKTQAATKGGKVSASETEEDRNQKTRPVKKVAGKVQTKEQNARKTSRAESGADGKPSRKKPEVRGRSSQQRGRRGRVLSKTESEGSEEEAMDDSVSHSPVLISSSEGKISDGGISDKPSKKGASDTTSPKTSGEDRKSVKSRHISGSVKRMNSPSSEEEPRPKRHRRVLSVVSDFESSLNQTTSGDDSDYVPDNSEESRTVETRPNTRRTRQTNRVIPPSPSPRKVLPHSSAGMLRKTSSRSPLRNVLRSPAVQSVTVSPTKRVSRSSTSEEDLSNTRSRKDLTTSPRRKNSSLSPSPKEVPTSPNRKDLSKSPSKNGSGSPPKKANNSPSNKQLLSANKPGSDMVRTSPRKTRHSQEVENSPASSSPQSSVPSPRSPPRVTRVRQPAPEDAVSKRVASHAPDEFPVASPRRAATRSTGKQKFHKSVSPSHVSMGDLHAQSPITSHQSPLRLSRPTTRNSPCTQNVISPAKSFPKSKPLQTSSPVRCSPRRHGTPTSSSESQSSSHRGSQQKPKFLTAATRASHHSTPVQSPARSNTPRQMIIVDDEISLNISGVSDDVSLFDADENEGLHVQTESSEEEWASCAESTPSSQPFNIRSTQQNTRNKDTGSAARNAHSSEELINSSNMESFGNSSLPSTLFYGKSSSGDDVTAVPPLQQHLLPPGLVPCIVKLFKAQTMSVGRGTKTQSYDVYK